MTIQQRAMGTPFAVLYRYPDIPRVPTDAEIELAAKKAYSQKKWKQEIARRAKREATNNAASPQKE